MVAQHQYGTALVIGASGGIGAALTQALTDSGQWSRVIPLGRRSSPALYITDEASVAAAVAQLAPELSGEQFAPRLVINAVGVLGKQGCVAEKSLQQIDPMALQRTFAINTFGPALLLKHFLPLLPRSGRSVFALLSARVGSIGDNRLGGWYSYRASKAALNQLVRTAAVELRRTRPQSLVVAVHPGTVATSLSEPFGKAGLEVQPPAVAAQRILQVLGALTPAQSGEFFDHQGAPIPW